MKNISKSLLFSFIVIMLISFSAHLTISKSGINQHRADLQQINAEQLHECLDTSQDVISKDTLLDCMPTLKQEQAVEYSTFSLSRFIFFIAFGFAVVSIVSAITMFVHSSNLRKKLQVAISKGFKWNEFVIALTLLANFIVCAALYVFFSNDSIPLLIKQQAYFTMWIFYSVFLGAAAVYCLLRNSDLYSNLFPQYVKKLAVTPIQDKEKEHRTARLPKLAYKLEQRYGLYIVYIVGIILVIFTMHMDVHNLTENTLFDSFSTKNVFLTFIEILINFLPSVLVFLMVYFVLVRSKDLQKYGDNRPFLQRMGTSLVIFGLLTFSMMSVYFLLLLIKYLVMDQHTIVELVTLIPNKMMYFLSLAVGTLVLTIMDDRIRNKKAVKASVLAKAIPLGKMNNFKFFLARTLDDYVEPASTEFVRNADKPSKNYLQQNLQMQIHHASEILNVLNEQDSTQNRAILNAAEGELKQFLIKLNTILLTVNQLDYNDTTLHTEYLKAVHCNFELKEMIKDLLEKLY